MHGSVDPPAVVFHTFDVFDTVLTRTVGDFTALFALLGTRMRAAGLVECEPAVVAAARSRAEHWLPSRLGRGPTLLEIHREIARSLGLPEGTPERSVELELEIERDVSRPVPGAAERIAHARATTPDGRVGFVSDTPLARHTLVAMLGAAGLWREGDLCVSSAETGAEKYTGRLFPIVAETLGLAPAQIRHTGDNAWSDVAMARLHGFRAEHVTAGCLTRYETALEAQAGATAGLTSWLSGASRLVRLDAAQRGVRPEVAAVAAGVFTPIMVGFTLWLVQQVRRRGLRRLYFVSRDGELPLRVAAPICARLAPEVQCRYLYGSRAAWHYGSTALDPNRRLADWIANHHDTEVTPRMLLARARVDADEARRLAPSRLFTARHLDRVLSHADRHAIIEALESGPLGELLRTRSAQDRDLLVDYLRQEGFDDGVPSAVVDVGWMGRTSRSLDDVLVAAGFGSPRAYLYLGLCAGADRHSGPRVAARHDAWLHDDDAGHGAPLPLPAQTTLLVETMCSGTEGATMGYRRDGDRVEPVLLTPKNNRALDWGLHGVHEVVADTAATLARHSPLHPQVDLRAACLAVIESFWEHPTAAEVAAWADFPYDETGQSDGDQPLAGPVDAAFVLGQLRAGRFRLRPANSWRAGTTAMSPLPWRMLLTARTAHQRHGARLRRIPRRLRIEWRRRRG